MGQRFLRSLWLALSLTLAGEPASAAPRLSAKDVEKVPAVGLRALPAAPGLRALSALPSGSPSVVSPLVASDNRPVVAAALAALRQPLSKQGDGLSLDAAARLALVFDGVRAAIGPTGDAPASLPAPPTSDLFLDQSLSEARRSLTRDSVNLPAAFSALETIAFSRPYLGAAVYDRWIQARGRRLLALDRLLGRAVRASILAKIAEGDFSGARHRLDELAERHPHWAAAHEPLLAHLRGALPVDGPKGAVPQPPAGDAAALFSRLGQEHQPTLYLVESIKSLDPAWAAAHAEELEQARQEAIAGIYQEFEAKKAPSLIEARRLNRYLQAVGRGANALYGFKEPAKQDPNSMMCTIMSILNGFEATIGFSDRSMDLEKFTKMVREILKNNELGSTVGLSTHRVRTLTAALGYSLRVVEMQHRLRHPFREGELIAELRRGQIVIPVFTIAELSDDGKSINSLEHKGFLRDAYYDAVEGRWIFLMMDPLIGRMSFYDFDEMKTFLHKLFIIKTEKPMATPPTNGAGG